MTKEQKRIVKNLEKIWELNEDLYRDDDISVSLEFNSDDAIFTNRDGNIVDGAIFSMIIRRKSSNNIDIYIGILDDNDVKYLSGMYGGEGFWGDYEDSDDTIEESIDYFNRKCTEYLQKYGILDAINFIPLNLSTAINDSDTTINNKLLKDFIYKIDDSNKLEVESNYDSIDEFFDDTNDESFENHEAICIIAVDTKVPLIKIEKTQDKAVNTYKFIVDITNEDGDNYSVKSIISSKEKLEQLLKATVDSLRNYPQFSKYADDLENCL